MVTFPPQLLHAQAGPVGHGLEVDRGGGDPLGVRLEAVGEVAAVRQVLPWGAVGGSEDGCTYP